MKCQDCGLIQSAASRCKGCGSIQDTVLVAATTSSVEPFETSGKHSGYRAAFWELAKEILFYVESTVNPLYFYGRCAVYLIFFVWGWKFIFMDYDVVAGELPLVSYSFMHGVNLPFHEAGHVIFVPFGRFMTILGGSLGQLLIPFIVFCALLLKTRDTFGATIGLWWLGQSFVDLAPYINDARAGQLLLLSGFTGREMPGIHDWENILGDLGWIQYDHTIAGFVNAIGVALLLISFLWGAYVLYLQYKNLDRIFPQSSQINKIENYPPSAKL